MEIIDSVFHNFYIPPVVFSVVQDEVPGEDIRMCVDGKQRLTSIQRFMDGHVRALVFLFCPSSYDASRFLVCILHVPLLFNLESDTSVSQR